MKREQDYYEINLKMHEAGCTIFQLMGMMAIKENRPPTEEMKKAITKTKKLIDETEEFFRCE